MKVAISFLKSNKSLKETLKEIDASSADFIHVDVMDGNFVAAKNDDLDYLIEQLKKCIKPLDVHLMMQGEALEKAIERFAELNVSCITIHVELNNAKTILNIIKDKNIPCGIAINPDTKIDMILPYIHDISSLLVMSVYPGKGGQKYLDSTTQKLEYLKKLVPSNIELKVDGGIDDKSIILVENLVDTVVVGSFACNSAYSLEEQINKLLK